MFGKKAKSERPFTSMLAEELMRAELRILYGDGVRLFQCDIEASRASLKGCDSTTLSTPEREALSHEYMDGAVSERFVKISAIVGPFERCFPENPPEDRRRKLRRVEAECRIYTITTGCTSWQPHYLKFVVKDEFGGVVAIEHRNYVDGRVNGEELPANAINPCQDMSDSQVPATYRSIHRELHDGVAR